MNIEAIRKRYEEYRKLYTDNWPDYALNAFNRCLDDLDDCLDALRWRKVEEEKPFPDKLVELKRDDYVVSGKLKFNDTRKVEYWETAVGVYEYSRFDKWREI